MDVVVVALNKDRRVLPPPTPFVGAFYGYTYGACYVHRYMCTYVYYVGSMYDESRRVRGPYFHTYE